MFMEHDDLFYGVLSMETNYILAMCQKEAIKHILKLIII